MRQLVCAFFLFTIFFNESKAQIISSNTRLESGFLRPPVSARPRALWPWVNGNYSLSQITYELEEAKAKGMGGFDIWDVGVSVDPDRVVPAGPPFLGDESVQAIAHAIREADRLGLELGLTISSSWNAGGSWVKPEHSAMGLYRSDTIIDGGQSINLSIPFPVIKYLGDSSIMPLNRETNAPAYSKEVAVVAHKFQHDSLILSSDEIILFNASSDGRISGRLPEGRWRIVRYVCAPTGQPLAIPSTNSKGLMLDHFSADAQRANISYIFDRLLPVTGSLKNRSLKYLYADSYEVNSAVWTPLMPEEFKRRAGYDMRSFLPLLDGFRFSDADSTERFMFDYRKTLSDLIIDNHYVLGRKLCEEQGIGFCAEAGGPGKPIHNVPFEDLKALGSLTIPRGEFWNKHPQLELLQIIKGIASASHIYNQKFVEAESFTSVWLWQEGPHELKPLADRAMCEGLNRFVYHTFPHTPPESGNPGWVYNFGTLINTTNGWWPKSTGFHHYIARCSYMLQQGNFVGDVAFYYGDDAPNFVAPKTIHPSLGEGYDYDVINTEVLLSRITVRNGKLFLPHGQSYEILVLPNEQKMSLAVARKLRALVMAGAVVVGPKPVTSYTLKNAKAEQEELMKIADALWGRSAQVMGEKATGKGKVIWGKSLRTVLSEKQIVADFILKSEEPRSIDFIHRRTADADIYFVRNINERPVAGRFIARVANKIPEYWNIETGDIISIPDYRFVDRQTEFPLSLPPHGSAMIVFRRASSQQNTGSGSTPDSLGYRYYGKRIVSAAADTGRNESSFIDIPNPWTVHFEQPSAAPVRYNLTRLEPLHLSAEPGIRYFSGMASYRNSFLLDKMPAKNEAIIINLGAVREIADLYINGVAVANLWHEPYEADITSYLKAGINYLVVDVVTTPNNRLVGESLLNPKNNTIRSNINRLPNAWMKPFSEAPLLRSGLMGPVRIRKARTVAAQP